MEYSAPQVRDTPEPFVSSVRARTFGLHTELERLAVELYARGVSTCDIEDAFTDETGRRFLSRAAVSEITERLRPNNEDFCKHELSDHAIVYVRFDDMRRAAAAGPARRCLPPGGSARTDARSCLI